MGNFSGRVSTSSTFRVPTTRPKVFNATLPHLSVARDHCRRPSREQNMPSRSRDALADPPVSRMRRFAHETTSEDPFVSRTRLFAQETTSEGHSVSRTRRLAQETTSEGHSVSRTRRLAHETTSEGHSVSRTRRLAHETTLEDPPVSRTRRLAHETTLEDTDKPPPVPILSPGHFGTPDKPLLYQKLSHSLFRITYFLRSCFELFV